MTVSFFVARYRVGSTSSAPKRKSDILNPANCPETNVVTWGALDEHLHLGEEKTHIELERTLKVGTGGRVERIIALRSSKLGQRYVLGGGRIAVVVVAAVALAEVVISLRMILCLQIVRFPCLAKRRYAPMERRTYGGTDPLIEMRGRI